MRAGQIAFADDVIPLDQPETANRIAEHSPAGRVPVLIDGDLHIWETLAIIEYLCERHPESSLWPEDRRTRALARAVSNEMHAGFLALREHMPMNMRRARKPHPDGVPAEVGRDIARIREIWRDARSVYGSTGPFLFGDFCAADAMYAPVVSRFSTYCVDVGDIERAYMDAVMAHPAFMAWQSAAIAEPWSIPREDID